MPASATWTDAQCRSVINSLNWKIKLIYSAWDERDRAYATADNYYNLSEQAYRAGNDRAGDWYYGLYVSWLNYGNQRNSLANTYIDQFYSTLDWARRNGC